MVVLDRQAELERIAAERLAEERVASREARRALLWCLLGCVGWCGAGMFILGIAFYVTDLQLGWVFFWTGLTVGYAGMCYSLWRFYLRGEERGDW